MVRCQYPDSGGVIECTQEQFDVVYAPKGWVLVDSDTPLTDQSFSPEGGGQAQPPAPAPLPETPVATTTASPAGSMTNPIPAPAPADQPTE